MHVCNVPFLIEEEDDVKNFEAPFRSTPVKAKSQATLEAVDRIIENTIPLKSLQSFPSISPLGRYGIARKKQLSFEAWEPGKPPDLPVTSTKWSEHESRLR